MSRKFVEISIEELKNKIAFYSKNEEYPYSLINAIRSDLKVQFDLENFSDKKNCIGPCGMMGYHTLENGLTFCGMCAGGDWEFPVFFIVYWDGKKLRGYIPTYGNPWNTKTKKAFGNDNDADLAELKRRCPELKDINDFDAIEEVEFDSDLIKEDILERIIKR